MLTTSFIPTTHSNKLHSTKATKMRKNGEVRFCVYFGKSKYREAEERARRNDISFHKQSINRAHTSSLSSIRQQSERAKWSFSVAPAQGITASQYLIATNALSFLFELPTSVTTDAETKLCNRFVKSYSMIYQNTPVNLPILPIAVISKIV